MNYDEKYLSIIKDIVLRHINKNEHLVFLFGSRAKKISKKSSDIDIGILGNGPLGKIYYKIIDEIEDSIVPLKVDIIDFYFVDNDFKNEVMKEIEIWNDPQKIN